MIDTTATIIESPPEQLTEASKNRWPPLWRRLALAGVMLVSIFMNFYQLGQIGFGNLYYASAIRSMLDSWHNFFFVSFDPGGFGSPSFRGKQSKNWSGGREQRDCPSLNLVRKPNKSRRTNLAKPAYHRRDYQQ